MRNASGETLMCGIAGLFGPPRRQPPAIVCALISALRHRGPDDHGLWSSENGRVVLGQRRLAVIDLSSHGHQPMTSSSRRYTVTFNGEIYNFRELRRELTSLGHAFRGDSDTEVMLAAFDQWGVLGVLPRLNGMFAAGVYDALDDRLYCFRDRLGLKPLYYQWCAEGFAFSSEFTPPFAALSGRKISRDALALYLRYNFIPAPATIYEGVYKLPPATLAVVTEASLSSRRFHEERPYWSVLEQADAQLVSRDESMSMDDAVDRVEAALCRSVEQRMIADVPLGAFLSGGIDSSLIVAHMQQIARCPVRTFTVGFSDADWNEAADARQVAQHLGTDHTELIVTERDAMEVVPLLPRMYGEPFADSSQIPTFLVSKLTRQSVTVALSGDGGDELFTGYATYQRLTRMQRTLGTIPGAMFGAAAQLLRSRSCRRALVQVLGDQFYDWAFNAFRLFARDREAWIPEAVHADLSMAERLLIDHRPGSSLRPYRRCAGNLTEQKMSDDLLQYLPDDILTKVDRASMAVSLEVRAPFTDDHELFDVAWSIPFRHKSQGRGGKLVLKEALARHLPRALFERPKRGFAVPLGRWLNGPLQGWVQDCVNPDTLRRQGFLDPDVVGELLVCNRQETEWHAYKLWAVCLFQSWLESVHGASTSAPLGDAVAAFADTCQ